MWHVGLAGLDDNLNRIRATRTSRISDDLQALALQNLVCQEMILLFEICFNLQQVVCPFQANTQFSEEECI